MMVGGIIMAVTSVLSFLIVPTRVQAAREQAPASRCSDSESESTGPAHRPSKKRTGTASSPPKSGSVWLGGHIGGFHAAVYLQDLACHPLRSWRGQIQGRQGDVVYFSELLHRSTIAHFL